MYNPPRGDNIVLYVYPGYTPPEDLLLHVSTEPLNQSDVNASLSAMYAESEAVFYQQLDCTLLDGGLFCDAELTLPFVLGEAELRPLFSDTTTWQVVPCTADATLLKSAAETETHYIGAVIGAAWLSPLTVSVDFCVGGNATLSPLFAESTVSITIPAIGDGNILPMRADAAGGLLAFAEADVAMRPFFAEAMMSYPAASTSSVGILAYPSVRMDDFPHPAGDVPEITTILQFSR